MPIGVNTQEGGLQALVAGSGISVTNNNTISVNNSSSLTTDGEGKLSVNPSEIDVTNLRNADTLSLGQFQGTFDSAVNLSNFADASKGDFWTYNDESSSSLGGQTFNVGDQLWCTSPVTGTPVDLTTNFSVVHNTTGVASVDEFGTVKLSDTTPLENNPVASVGSSQAVAREDHVHPEHVMSVIEVLSSGADTSGLEADQGVVLYDNSVGKATLEVHKGGSVKTLDLNSWNSTLDKPNYLNRISVDSFFWLRGDGSSAGDIRVAIVSDEITYQVLQSDLTTWEEATLADFNLAGHGSLSAKLTALESAREFAGGLDASGDLTQLDDALNGQYWIVDTDGTLSGQEMTVNSMVICHTDVIGTPADLSSFAYIASTTNNMTGATSTVDGVGGTVPAPLAGQQETTLHGDGTWRVPYSSIVQDDMGLIGINLNSPSVELDIEGSVAVKNGGSDYFFIHNTATSFMKDDYLVTFGADVDFSMGYNSSADSFVLVDGNNLNNNQRLVLNSSGNIGIGRTPSYKLDVDGEIYPRGGLIGYVGGTPTTGRVGEYSNTVTSNLDFTASASQTLATRVLTAGVWLVWATLRIEQDTAEPDTSYFYFGMTDLSTSSVNISSYSNRYNFTGHNADGTVSAPPRVFSSSANNTIYFRVYANFASEADSVSVRHQAVRIA